MDRVYKTDIPAYVESLAALRKAFAKLETSTDWGRLRIDPLLAHARGLLRIQRSPKFARESSRLRKGVRMFRSDLLYLRENIRALKAILDAEQERERRSPATAAPARRAAKRAR